MIHQIENGLSRLEIPLPGNPLISINCYLIKGRQRFLLIDTGMNRRECLEEIQRNMEREGVDPGNTDFFITHFHADHIGLISKLARPESRIYFSKEELGRVRGRIFGPSGIAHAWLLDFQRARSSISQMSTQAVIMGPEKGLFSTFKMVCDK